MVLIIHLIYCDMALLHYPDKITCCFVLLVSINNTNVDVWRLKYTDLIKG